MHLIFFPLSPKKTFVHQGGIWQNILQPSRLLFHCTSLSLSQPVGVFGKRLPPARLTKPPSGPPSNNYKLFYSYPKSIATKSNTSFYADFRPALFYDFLQRAVSRNKPCRKEYLIPSVCISEQQNGQQILL